MLQSTQSTPDILVPIFGLVSFVEEAYSFIEGVHKVHSVALSQMQHLES